jgi:N-acetylmuramoyl-L-alanine amidase
MDTYQFKISNIIQMDTTKQMSLLRKTVMVYLIVFFSFPSFLHANNSLIIDRHINRIIIDPGISICENDINLEISKSLETAIQSHFDIEVLLTRQYDARLSINERIDIVNESHSDLLVSIQTNSIENDQAKWIEICYLNIMVDEKVLIQWVENQSVYKNSSGELKNIYRDLLINSKISESEILAKNVHSSISNHLEQAFPEIVDRGSKQAPLEILLDSSIPSIAVLIGSISNSQNCCFFSSEKFYKELVAGIVKGISAFINDKRI